jgi:CubicO group peptidase (beta-lactamase class C family)
MRKLKAWNVRIFLGAAALLLTGCANPLLEVSLERRMEALHVSGMQAAAIKGDSVVWNWSFGVSDVATGSPMADDTLLMIGSISKTLTATIIMQLVAEARLSLDDDVNSYLPFGVRNPHYPDTPITARMLLGHRAGILDNWYYLYESFTDHSPADLETLLRSYLLPGGARYDAQANWYSGAPPGSVEIYSSVDLTLLAFMAERLEGQPFASVFETRLRSPLNLDPGGGWQPDQTDSSRLAAGTEISGARVPVQSPLMWPAGSYLTNAVSLGTFLAIYVNGGTVKGTEFLPAETVKAMLPETAQPGTYGLAWCLSANTYNGSHLWSHGGKTFGFWGLACFDPERRTGAVVLTNGDIMSTYVFNEIVAMVLEKAGEY